MLAEKEGGTTIEKEAIKKVMRETLEYSLSNLEEQDLQKTLENIDAHFQEMKEIIGSDEYTAMCLPQLIHNLKAKNSEEQKAYLKAIANFARSYYLLYGKMPHKNKRLLLLMLSGIVHTTSSAEGVNKYIYEFYKTAKQIQMSYEENAVKESIKLEAIRKEIERLNKGIFAIFRKRRIRSMGVKERRQLAKIQKARSKSEEYASLAKGIGSFLFKKA